MSAPGWSARARLAFLVMVGTLAYASVGLGSTFPGSNGKIVYASNQGGNTDLYTRNADGSGVTRLTTDLSAELDPSFSADGMKIAFENDRSGSKDIWVMNADGSAETNLTPTAGADTDPSFSPDGSKIAFESDRSGSSDIWVMNADGTGATNLTPTAGADSDPSFSPDGSRIVFESQRSGIDIWLMNADGSGQTNLTTTGGPDFDPNWSPDGSRLAFDSLRSGSFDVWVMNADGSGPIDLTPVDGIDSDPSFSPDGSKIAFESTRSGNYDIWVMNADGSSPINYTSSNLGGDDSPDWGVVANPPAAPTVTASTPGSVANDNTPEIQGSAAVGTVVRLYTNSTCTSAVAGTGSAAQFASPGLTVSVADNSSTTFYASATNGAGASPCSSSSITYVEDSAASQTQIDSGPGDRTSDPTPSFDFSADESPASFECRVDGGGWSGCSSPHTTAQLADGPHSFEVRAIDAAGNLDPTPASRSFTVDTSAPQTQIDSGPSGATSDTRPRFGFSADESPASFECRVDGGPWSGCSSPQTTAQLADGPHSFEVRAIDAAGNLDPTPASRSFTVDTSAPQTQIDSGPGGRTSDPTPSFDFSADESPASFQCRVDFGIWSDCSSPQRTASLGDGEHSFEVRAIDAAGNLDLSPSTRTFTVDTNAPQTQIDSGPSRSTSDKRPRFRFSADESPASFQCRVGGSGWTACSSPETTAQLADGPHDFEVRAIDAAGNVDPTPASRSFKVDTSAPQTQIDSGPSGPTPDATPRFAFSADEAVESFQCRVDFAVWLACSSPETTASLEDGEHSFEVRAIDAADNVDPSPAENRFTVGTNFPQARIDSTPSDPVDEVNTSPPVPQAPSTPPVADDPSPEPTSPPPARVAPPQPSEDDSEAAFLLPAEPSGRVPQTPAAGGRQRGSVGERATIVADPGDPTGQPTDEGGIGRDLVEALKTAAPLVGRGAFPGVLLLLIFMFIAIQNRIDRNDPKLALAPIDQEPYLYFQPRGTVGGP